MARDASATKARVIAAAYDESAEYGTAAARADRAPDTAAAKKRMISGRRHGTNETAFRGHAASAVHGSTVGLTAAACYDWSDDASGLFSLGVGMVMVATLAATSALSALVTWACGSPPRCGRATRLLRRPRTRRGRAG